MSVQKHSRGFTDMQEIDSEAALGRMRIGADILNTGEAAKL
jgi:hypothetical protein